MAGAIVNKVLDLFGIESNDDVFQTLNTMKSKIENESNYNNNPSNENEKVRKTMIFLLKL